jgi:L-seryl-tRNA(Ser) seleniumtransferase
MSGADSRRRVPRTDALLADERLAEAALRLGQTIVKDAVRHVQRELRSGEFVIEPESGGPQTSEQMVTAVLQRLPVAATQLSAVINATGILLHTNLGRAPLSAAARAALMVASGYVDVEFDLASGRRAKRGAGALDAALAAVTGTQAVHVVNNGAAAVLLAAATLARGKEVIISRGEMVEIGDRFRLPDLVEAAGARLREVGSTNRTHLRDYAAAVNENTAFVLKVHSSNFSMDGFVSSVAIGDLVGLGVPVVADLGGGLLAPDPLLPNEPDVQTAIGSGAALVTCSGDKLLGGPQCGLAFGDTETIERLRTHPMARALRLDKLALAALEATLRGPTPPVWQSLRIDQRELQRRSARLASATGGTVVPHDGQVGGGVASGQLLPGWAVAYDPALADRMRLGTPPVIGRVTRDQFLIDLRCVPVQSDDELIQAVLACM